jgi:Cathepsin propeptide inhibitor domain (I29)
MAISYRCLVTFLVLFALSPFKRGPVSITVADDPLLPVFEQWMKDYGRLYGSPTEKLQRFQVFKDNYQFVESIKNQPGLTYTVGLNAFADLTNEEFAQRYTTRLGASSTICTSFGYENMAASEIPSSIDWRDLGAVTPVKNQNPCGELNN